MAGPAELLEDIKRLLGDLPERLDNVMDRRDRTAETPRERRARERHDGSAGVGGMGEGGPEPPLSQQGEGNARLLGRVVSSGAAMGLPGFGGALQGINTLLRLQEMMKALAAMRESMKPPPLEEIEFSPPPEAPWGQGPIPLSEPPKTVPLEPEGGLGREEHWGERVPVAPSAEEPLTARPVLPGQRQRGWGDAETIPLMPEGREAARPWENRAGADPSSRLGETIPLRPESARPIIERPVPPSPVPLADESPPIPLVGASPPLPPPPSRRLGETVGARPPGQAPLPGTQPFPEPPPAPPAHFGPPIPFASEGPEPPPGTPPGPTPPPGTIPAEPAGPRSTAHLEPTGMERWGGSARRLFLEHEVAGPGVAGASSEVGRGDASADFMGELGKGMERLNRSVEKLTNALEKKADEGESAPAQRPAAPSRAQRGTGRISPNPPLGKELGDGAGGEAGDTAAVDVEVEEAAIAAL